MFTYHYHEIFYHEILSYLNLKMNFRFFDFPSGEIFCMGKNPCGDSEKSAWGF